MTTLTAAPVTTPGTGQILVVDEVLLDPQAYRAQALARPFRTIQTGDESWHGIALGPDATLAAMVADVLPGAQTTLTFFRQSPEGQPEPNFIHSDEGMGDWTAILYLNPAPADGDGTDFWRYLESGAVAGSARALPKDPARWTCWRHVPAQFNRLLVFDARYFHSRAIEANYGAGDDARLIQVAFGTYAPPTAATILRPATVADIPRLVAMGQAFRASSGYAPYLREDPAQMARLGAFLIADARGLLLVAERAGLVVGMIGVLVVPNHLSGDLTAGELFFWVDPAARGCGVRLLRQAERWAATVGATTMTMIAPTPDEIGPLYARFGYAPIEVLYQKELTPCL